MRIDGTSRAYDMMQAAMTGKSGGADFAALLEKAGVSGKTDFTKMTRAEMKDVAKKLFDSGVIDLTQLGMLQMAGPIGKLGPNGQFISFTEAEQKAIDSQPMNYFRVAGDAMRFIESQGKQYDSTSGYANWQHILSVLRERQGMEI
ncbi:MAG TPA: hypothetical protein VFQ91_27290 [Bryobacteraceae bacterium]|nr:hypothetical protein [Bryobacteraceae bacterium]